MKNLLLYGEIGWEITSADVVAWLMENKDEQVEIHVNSPGGLVYEAIAIREAIRGVKDCTIFVDSIAASAAAIITLCGKPVKMGQFAQLMLHSASSYAQGNKKEMQKQMEELDKVDRQLASMIAEKMGKTEDEIYNTYFDGEDHWLTADECSEMGIAEIVTIEDRKKLKTNALVFDCMNGRPQEHKNIKTNKSTMDFKNFQSVSAFADCANDEAVLAKAQSLSDSLASAEKQIAELNETAKKYNDLLAQLAKEQGEADQKLIDEAVADGRIAEESKAAFVALMTADRENAIKVINAIAKPAVAPAPKADEGKKVADYIKDGKQTKVVMDSWAEALKNIKK